MVTRPHGPAIRRSLSPSTIAWPTADAVPRSAMKRVAPSLRERDLATASMMPIDAALDVGCRAADLQHVPAFRHIGVDERGAAGLSSRHVQTHTSRRSLTRSGEASTGAELKAVE